jgi:predicted phage terminase large subunit-like protein
MVSVIHNEPRIPANVAPLLSAYLKRKQGRGSPASFAQQVTRGKYELPPHLALLNSKLTAVASGEISRLMILAPPRHGKSYLCSRFFPGWYLGTHPSDRIILASYESDIASRWGRMVRDDLTEHGQTLFGVRLSQDSTSAGRWDIAGHEGGMVALGAGGALTGRGGNIIILDDCVKNSEEAHSETQRQKLQEWFRSVLFTRLEPQGAIIATGTRWHESDLLGSILAEAENGGDQWEVVRLPALAEEDDQLGRQPGEALWPERFDVEALESIRRTVGSYVWSALYQQSPAPASGGIIQRHWFKRWTRATLPPGFDYQLQSWDLAFKGENQNDYVCGQVWGCVGADRFLLDQVHGHLDFPQTISAIKALSLKWPLTYHKLVEDAANGAALIATLKHEISGLIPVKPQGNKEARVHAITAQLESGNVYIPESATAPWVDGFIDECCGFPNAKHDDRVDTLSQALNYIARPMWVVTYEDEFYL